MVPVALLTGFLGSGKTTLLNQLIRQRGASASASAPSAGKLAILVNELGAVGIDGALLPPGAARQVELPGGCLCCTLDENLELSLRQLVDSEPALELVVIETTGVAEPLPILWTLTGEALADRVRMAAVVTVVDTLEHARNRTLAPAVDHQVDHADIVVISKLDHPDAGERCRTEVLELVRARAPGAAIIAERTPAAGAAVLTELLADPALGERERSIPAMLPATRPGHPFESISIAIDVTLDFEELSTELEALPPSWVRIKGICHAVDRSTGSAQPRWIAFHRVGARVSAEVLDENPELSHRGTAVALGGDLDAERLAACIRKAMLTSSP